MWLFLFKNRLSINTSKIFDAISISNVYKLEYFSLFSFDLRRSSDGLDQNCAKICWKWIDLLQNMIVKKMYFSACFSDILSQINAMDNSNTPVIEPNKLRSMQICWALCRTFLIKITRNSFGCAIFSDESDGNFSHLLKMFIVYPFWYLLSTLLLCA